MIDLELQSAYRQRLFEILGVDVGETLAPPPGASGPVGVDAAVQRSQASLDAHGRLRLPAALVRASVWAESRSYLLADFPFAAPAIWDPALWQELVATLDQDLDCFGDERDAWTMRRIYRAMQTGELDSRDRVTVPQHFLSDYGLSGKVALVSYAGRVVVLTPGRAHRPQ